MNSTPQLRFKKTIQDRTYSLLDNLRDCTLLFIGIDKGMVNVGDTFDVQTGGNVVFVFMDTNKKKYHRLNMQFIGSLIALDEKSQEFVMDIVPSDTVDLGTYPVHTTFVLEGLSVLENFEIFWHKDKALLKEKSEFRSYLHFLSDTEISALEIIWDYPLWFVMKFSSGLILLIERGDSLNSCTLYKHNTHTFQERKKILIEEYEGKLKIERVY